MNTLPEKFSIQIEHGEAGLWFATSPEIKGLFVATKTATDALNAIPRVLAELAAAALPERAAEGKEG